MGDIDKVRFVKEGAKIIMKEVVADVEFNSKDVLNNIDRLNGAIDKATEDLQNLHDSIPKTEKVIEINKDRLKQLKQFEEWALEVQHSKVRAIIPAIHQEVFDRVEKEYVFDPILTEESNRLQKFRIYQSYMSKHQRVIDEIASSVMKEDFYIHPVLENPWK